MNAYEKILLIPSAEDRAVFFDECLKRMDKELYQGVVAAAGDDISIYRHLHDYCLAHRAKETIDFTGDEALPEPVVEEKPSKKKKEVVEASVEDAAV